MAKTNYMKNRYKLLLMVHELHKHGYENLRVVPSLSPSGLSWRCEFVTGRGEVFYASNWLQNFEEIKKPIRLTPHELACRFERENFVFADKCRGENSEYAEWYKNMIDILKVGELPYAYADYFSPGDFWNTSEGNEIKTLPGEKDYYFNY